MVGLEALAFEPAYVDITAGSQEVSLLFTVRHSDAAVQQPHGKLSIRLGGLNSGFVGQAHLPEFQYGEDLYWYGGATWVSGTPQPSNYVYKWAVPQQANQELAKWSVTEFTAADERGGSLTLNRRRLAAFPGSTLTAKSIVDSTPPAFSAAALDPGHGLHRPFVYTGGSTPGEMRYRVELSDYGSGIWRGSLRMVGPGGARINTPFEQVLNQYGRNCGYYGSDLNYGPCGVTAQFPAGTAAGVWKVARITLWDNAGNTIVVTKPGAESVTVTSNATLQVTSFAASPNPVDTWRQATDITFRMSTTGAQSGLREVIVDGSGYGASCSQQSVTPVDEGGGTFSITIRAQKGLGRCEIRGVALVDGAGYAALYGELYGAPSTGVTITRVPNTTPPAVTAAELNPTSIPASRSGNTTITLTMYATEGLAPISSLEVSVYDATGNTVGGVFGGASLYNGKVTAYFYTQYGLPPSQYTIGFKLTDESGLSCSYGNPGTPEPPGGPVILTLTES